MNDTIDTSSNTYQIGGKHYVNMSIQPWDFFTDNDVPYLYCGAIKYARWRDKGGIDDLKKMLHFLNKIEDVGLCIHDINTYDIRDYVNQFDKTTATLLTYILVGDIPRAKRMLRNMIALEGKKR